MKILSKYLNDASKISVFLYGYFVLGILLSIFIGANIKLVLIPIILFLLLFISFFFTKISTFFIAEYNLTQYIIFICLINTLVFLTGKIENESHFFSTIRHYIGFNLKTVLIILNSIILLLYGISIKSRTLAYIYLGVFLIMILMIPLLYPKPFIDLFIILKQSIHDLLILKNPYNRIYTDIYEGTYDYVYKKQEIKLVYWPLNLYLLTPFQLILGDLRYGHLFYLLAGCFILYLGFKKKLKILVLSIALVFTCPYTFYMIKYAWIDSLAFPFFCLFFLAVSYRKKYFAFICMGIIMSLKLYFIPLFPLVVLYYHKEFSVFDYFKCISLSLGTFLICFMPFIVIDFKSLLYSIKYFSNSNPRYDALSIPGYLFNKGTNISRISGYLSVVILFFIYFLFYINKKFVLFSLIKYFILTLFSIFILSKQAFGNYYYNIILLSVCYIIIYISSYNEKSIILSDEV